MDQFAIYTQFSVFCYYYNVNQIFTISWSNTIALSPFFSIWKFLNSPYQIFVQCGIIDGWAWRHIERVHWYLPFGLDECLFAYSKVSIYYAMNLELFAMWIASPISCCTNHMLVPFDDAMMLWNKWFIGICNIDFFHFIPHLFQSIIILDIIHNIRLFTI